MGLILQQRQTLNLVMTNELRQAIELLQFSTYDLYQFIQEQQLENPLIELEDNASYSWKNTKPKSVDSSPRVDPIDFIASNEACMCDQLTEQVRWMDITDQERKMVDYLILNLDENGYLPISAEEMALNLNVKKDAVLRAIRILQQLEPVGVGARNLAECLALQLRYYHPEAAIAETIVTEHVDLLAKKKWYDLAKTMEISLEEVKLAYDLIQSLQPKPCNMLSNETTQYLNPDVIVDNTEGRFVVQLNDSYLPEVHFNNQYSGQLKGGLNKYVHDKFKSYQWLVNSIEQRRQTILKVTHAILQKQDGFLINGLSELVPLTLKEIADEINMHESTVSRATANKVIQTPHGSFEFRTFFTSKLRTKDGSSMSQTKVKLLLQDFVKQENKRKPFSDQKIADYFKTKKGITVSRRTIAKYREELNIPATSLRKEFDWA
ncbi:RNA polymerase sigma-54 factor [Virgibacillus phasianinus]|uniref:RNA polymerase sigma-54 factor n=1 Tax=Virgibacillus phasianinus TaxID=2017483 RepID=A0A220U3C5_9BACI|nr:RNA polymerase factor sigma-54 [Virgibacillus phasianinus]ASK62545.1 RNA polymerase sigma-54 factor [Virgibacillus phasianinus]